LLGGFNPLGAYVGAASAIGGYYGGRATGAWDPVTGMQIGGWAGDFGSAARGALRHGVRRAAMTRQAHTAPELIFAGSGAIIGGAYYGNATGALHGTQLGMMAGGIGAGLEGVLHLGRAPGAGL
jgi:hypothetical protein